jgi:formylglycine-generating enzyme required for sulfatase activity
MSEKEGQIYRLPTEAEWEYACRAGTTTKWHCGDDEAEIPRVAWYSLNSSGTHPVGGKEPNAWGLYDMHGNVLEWCQDGWREYRGDDATDPVGPAAASDRVFRGGSWGFDAEHCRAAYRDARGPQSRWSCLGFRTAAIPAGGMPAIDKHEK